jgi:2-isopropylmalate synthase
MDQWECHGVPFLVHATLGPEDGYRSEPDFLCRVLEAVIAEGASTINIPDTVGYAVPELYGNFLRDLRERIPNSDKAVWSVHCHNDLGMAVANSLAGVRIGGARQVECTINGLGERAGNCSLEEVVMAVRTRRDFFGLDVGVDTSQIVPASMVPSAVSRSCGASNVSQSNATSSSAIPRTSAR